MSSNILFLPFRRTLPVSLSDAMKQYISTKYDQHPDMFASDLEAIDRLRSEAIHVREPHASGIRKIQSYAAQLNWLGGKFPIDIGTDLAWYPALGYHTTQPTSQNNLRFELSNIIFNLASLYTQLATSLNRSTGEGLKAAQRYFCLAAGVMSYLRTDVIPDMRSTPAEDMDTVTLECLEQLLLAQAQECSWQKAVADGMRDATISRLAVKVSDFYAVGADHAAKSDAISSEWIHHMSAKHHHFAAAAQYRAACDCLEKRKYGEEVARLRDSLICVSEGLKEARWINKSVLNDLQGLKSRVQEDLKRAEKDNDMIYLIPVPSKSELKTLERATVATSKVPIEISQSSSLIGENGEFGPPLFLKLVPFVVHVASSIYTKRRDRLVNEQIISDLEALTNTLHDLLQSLNLPGSLQAIQRPLGLPPSLESHAEEIRQQDAVRRLSRSYEDVIALRTNDSTIYQEAVEILRSESTEDERARLKYGTERWARAPSDQAASNLHDQSKAIEGYMKSAASSDDLVKSKLNEWSRYISILAGPHRELVAFVPDTSRSSIPPRLEREASKLNSLLSEVNRLDLQRKRQIQNLREKANADDINSVINTEAARLEREYPTQKLEAAHFETFFSDRLKRYDLDTERLSSQEQEQEALCTDIKAASQAFEAARRGETSSATREREQALQKLETAYVKYKEIAQNIDGARTFYNDLAKMVGKFRDEAKSFVIDRRQEALNLERAMSAQFSSPLPIRSPGPVNSTWSPAMGIKFGAGGPPPPPAR